MIVTHAPTEGTSEGCPIGESYKRTAVLGLMTRDSGAEASLASPLELTLSNLRLTHGGFSPCLHTRHNKRILQPLLAGQS